MHWLHKDTSRLQDIAWELAEAHEGRGLRAPAL